MTPNAISSTINAYLANNWTEVATVPIRRINRDPEPKVPYIEMYFRPGQVRAIEIQGASQRPGVFKINVFTEPGNGTGQGEVYAGIIEDLFTNQYIDGVWCASGDLMPYTEDLGIDEALQAYHHQVTVPFTVISEG